MTINVNQFAQTTVQGELDMQIIKSGVLTGVVSANQATALHPGDKVKLDQTSGSILSFVSAATSEDAIGLVVFDAKKSAPVTGDYVQVALLHPGCVMYLTAGASITVQARLEFVSAAAATVQTQSAGKMIGIALDPASSGALLRVLLSDATQS